MRRGFLIREKSANWQIFVGMLSVGAFQLIVSLAAIGKDLMVAKQFGTTDVMDAFLLALLLPSLMMNTVNGSFDVAFIPEFIRVREREGEREAGLLFSNILGRYLSFLLVLSLVLLLFSPWILSGLTSGFEAQTRALTQSLFLILIPVLIVSGLGSAWGSVLKANAQYALPILSSGIVHLMVVITLFFKGDVWGIQALAIAMVAGLVLQVAFLFWGIKSRGGFYWPRWRGLDASTKRIERQYSPMIVGSLLMGATLFVDQSMAASIGSGSVSSLNYGNKLGVFVLGLGTMALSTAVLPHFSKMVACEDWKSIRHTLKTYVRLILILTVPLTLILIYFSAPIIRIVFERGAFTSGDTLLVGDIQALYLLQIPFYMTGILGVRLLSALSKNQVLMRISGINLFVNIFGNYILMQYWGVLGISFSTSLVYLISTILIYTALNRELNQRER